jgi:hypothetical protein
MRALASAGPSRFPQGMVLSKYRLRQTLALSLRIKGAFGEYSPHQPLLPRRAEILARVGRRVNDPANMKELLRFPRPVSVKELL